MPSHFGFWAVAITGLLAPSSLLCTRLFCRELSSFWQETYGAASWKRFGWEMGMRVIAIEYRGATILQQSMWWVPFYSVVLLSQFNAGRQLRRVPLLRLPTNKSRPARKTLYERYGQFSVALAYASWQVIGLRDEALGWVILGMSVAGLAFWLAP